jgi:hypothetical protein
MSGKWMAISEVDAGSRSRRSLVTNRSAHGNCRGEIASVCGAHPIPCAGDRGVRRDGSVGRSKIETREAEGQLADLLSRRSVSTPGDQ